MFDRDDNPEDPTKGRPQARSCSRCWRPSCRASRRPADWSPPPPASGIKSKATGEWLIPPSGSHLYLLAQGNLQRFVDLLTVRLWNAGYGYCKLATPNTQTGVAAVLTRAVVDLACFRPERLDYVAGARIAKNAPFYQDARGAHAGRR